MSRLVWCLQGLLLILAGGCAREEIDATYGKRRGTPGAESVNGTAVLAAMYESAGHRVITWRRLSPKLEEFDTIVWFPDSFGLPDEPQRLYLENWLLAQAGRTLVYVGRDYDAAIAYWNQMRLNAPPNQAVEVARRIAVAQSLHDERRAIQPLAKSCDWFVVQGDLPRRPVRVLEGPWSDRIDVAKLGIKLDARWKVPSGEDVSQWQSRAQYDDSDRPSFERLLYAAEDPLVTRVSRPSWNDSQILLVTNGSFLLNLPLVQHESRKLAGRLINACGPAGRVAFLESGSSGPLILDHEPSANAPTGFEVFTVWPIGVILLHLTALGLLACIALFPVFGRPRELPAAVTADFGQHVTALGELLERTGDQEYARNRIRQYHEQVNPDAKTTRKANS